MNKKIIIFTVTMSSVLLFSNFVLAFNPYGISDGLYMKLEEEKSALEYRLSQIESNSQNNPGLSAATIQSRINELIRERDGKKRYATGIYAQSGAIEMLSSALAEIDSQYKSQIDNLEQQKSLYDQQYSNEQSAASARQEAQELRKELNDLKLKIEEEKQAQLAKQLEDLRKGTEFKTPSLLDQLNKNTVRPSADNLFYKLDQMDDQFEAAKLFALVKTDSQDLYDQVVELAGIKYWGGYTELSDVFDYMDSLSEVKVGLVYTKMGIFNPELRKWVSELVKAKYPDGKFNTTVKKPKISDVPPVVSKKIFIKEDTLSTSTTETIKSTSTEGVMTQKELIKIPEKKVSWFRRFLNWFK